MLFKIWLCWVSLLPRFSLVSVRVDCSLVAIHELLIVVAAFLEHVLALVVARAFSICNSWAQEHRLCSCGTWS